MYFKRPSKTSLIFQLIIWLVFFIIICVLNKFAFTVSIVKTLPMSITNMVLNMLLVNLHLYYLIPKFFNNKKRGHYFIYFLFACIVFTALKAWVIYLSKPESVLETFWESKSVPIAAASSILLLTISLPFLWFDKLIEKEVEKAHLKNKALEAELLFLKNQINPHFLFNVLNNIYAMIYTGSRNAGTVVYKLSSLMRYMLYETNEKDISLVREIRYLEDYIDLQTIKQREKSTVTFQTSSLPEAIRIPPFIFIPFLENAFKHGNWDDTQEKGWIKSSFSYHNETLNFISENSIKPIANKEKYNGVGLANVQKRLQLYYPNKHKLSIDKTENIYAVSLQITFS